ncbi:MAG TPA: Cof-type HAD-IIB family hydrolase [Symbiobacteriaceae bacterium]|nr:Cof-type HAD-IIB family hydrolase [Symbiobacteriaceae bacterium]
MQYRLIALDLDGTLLTGRHEITPRTREALRAARERGIALAVATGRTHQSAREYSLRIGGGPVISCNGAAVADSSGEFLSVKAIPHAPLKRCLELCISQRLLLECYTPHGILLDKPMAHLKAYLDWVRPGLGLPRAIPALGVIWRTNRITTVRNLVTWSDKPDHAPVLKLLAVGEPAALKSVAAQIGREAPGVHITSSSWNNIEVTAAGVSKGYGLQMLGARLQIPREAMLAFGDSENDAEMLAYAGTGVAMGNAPEAVKARAARVTGTSDQDGVASVIEEMCLS